jgi:hypothetical protein
MMLCPSLPPEVEEVEAGQYVPLRWGPRVETRLAVGLDVGQAHDPSALAVVERRATMACGVSEPRREESAVYHVRHLARLPLRMAYPDQAAYVAAFMARPELEGAELVLDKTGIGRAIYDLFKAAGLKPIAVTITAGEAETRDGAGYRVPKLQLVSTLQARLHDRTLKIARNLPEGRVLAQELQNVRVGFTAAGGMTFGARVGAHDDLVLALALGVWSLSRRRSRVGLIPPGSWMM